VSREQAEEVVGQSVVLDVRFPELEVPRGTEVRVLGIMDYRRARECGMTKRNQIGVLNYLPQTLKELTVIENDLTSKGGYFIWD
jgi:hypothetical protein